MIDTRFKPKFKLDDLKKLPVELLSQGEKIRMVYVAFEGLGTEILAHLGYDLTEPYAEFLKTKLADLIEDVEDRVGKIDADDPTNTKDRWFHASFGLVLAAIYEGHWKIEEAHILLKMGQSSEFADYLAQAGVKYGRLLMVLDLCRLGVFDRIGSIQSALAGAALGGAKSGATRRKHSRVPTGEALSIERQRLIDAGKPSREISAMLAKKYGCTTDHIRKLLKRD